MEECLLAHRVLADERDANEPLPRHARDQGAAPPPGEAIARVDRHARGPDRWSPHEARGFHPWDVLVECEHRAVIVDAVGDDRPAVVSARQDQIQLITTSGTVLV